MTRYLAIGGNLDPTQCTAPAFSTTRPRRSIYLRVKRSELLPVMTIFDAPEPTQSIGERSVTTVPTQALAMMNSPMVRQQAEKLFARIKPTPETSVADAITRGYQIALGRSPTDAERHRMIDYVDQQKAALGGNTPDHENQSHEAHWWQSPDGSKIFSHHSAPIGEGIDPVKMAKYACNWETKTQQQISLWLPGVGDHGGGPTRDMLEVARRWQQSPFFPKLAFTTAQKFLDQLSGAASPPTSQIPTWNDELYLELHRGCYTNRADQKRFNRRCEDTLYEAELFASIQTLLTRAAYPKAELEAAWKKVLFNQFHDILPGTSITPVFTEANPSWQAAWDTGWNIRQTAMKAIAAQLSLPKLPQPQAQQITVFNSLNWSRSEVVAIAVEQTQSEQACFWQICDLDGKEIPSQPHCWREGGKTYCQVFFLAENIPSIGYRSYWLMPRSAGNPVPPPNASAFGLENDQIRVAIDPATGNLSELFDKVHNRSLLSRAGNDLQAFRDSGQYWDAWDIAANYPQYPLPPAQKIQIFYEDRGAITTRIRVVRKLGQSTFNQVYILDKGSRVLHIQTQVDWQERHVVVKAAFPLNVNAAHATYEIPCGAIQRTTRPQTDAEKAKWEVPALRWADLSDTASNNSYGVSILSDCKHGYDAKPNQIRLTLLRGSEWPDPTSDRGAHQFTYAVYPHDKSWQAAQTVRRGYELNQPLRAIVTQRSSATLLPPSGKFLDLQSNSLILTAFKPAEANPNLANLNQWILRCYEAHGSSATLNLSQNAGLLFGQGFGQSLDGRSATRVNLLEEPIAGTVESIGAWQIATVQVAKVP